MKHLLHFLILVAALTSQVTAEQKFESSAIVQIHPSMLVIPPAAGAKPTLTRNYLQNEMETIVAKETLLLAAQDLKLDLKADENTLANLKKKIAIQPMRGTDFIKISVKDSDKKKAARTATAIANAYIKRRKDAEMARAKAALDALDRALIQQSDLVQAHRKELTKLIQKYGIPYFDGGHSNPLGSTNANGVKLSQAALKALESAKPEDKLSVAASLKIPNSKVTHLFQTYQKALESVDFLAADHGNRHPKMVKARKDLNEARKKVQKATNELPGLLRKQIEKPEDVVEKIFRKNAYNQSKEDYEKSRDMLRETKIRQQEIRVLLKMPRDPATLHQKAD